MVTDIGTAKAQYYAPLLPLIGTRLQSRRVALVCLGSVAGAAECLADCRMLHWQLCDPAGLGAYHPLARLWGRGRTAVTASEAFMRALRTRTPWEDGWEFDAAPALTEQTYPELRRFLAANRPDLLLG